ncbi:MAG: rapA, partial [Rhodococcus erythropolis]|nr:rapA [Rhodococcus erythropolis]
MPRYRFSWSNLPESLLDQLCEHLFVDNGGLTSAEVLQSGYGARPKDNFVVEAWEPLRENWLNGDKPSRDWVVATLRELRDEHGRATSRRAQMDYLRELRNAKTLRAVVLEAFIELGEAGPDEP